MLFDPCAAVRGAAAGVLASVVSGWLSSVKRGGGSGGGGGSAAVRQLDVVRGLHVGLLEAMQKERSASCVLALVRAVGLIAATVPYEQLLPLPTTSTSAPPITSTPLLTPLIDHLLSLLPPPVVSTVSRSVPSSPSSAMRSLTSPHSQSSELRSAIFSSLSSLLDHSLAELDRYVNATNASSSSPLSLIPLLLSNAASRSPSDSASDAFLPLSKLARHYATILAQHWQPNNGLSLHTILITSLTRSHDTVGRLSALRLLEEWTKTDASQLNDESDDTADDSGGGGGIKEPPNSAFFQLPGVADMYGHQLPQLFHERPSGGASVPSSAAGSHSAVRARVVTLLSFVPYSTWVSLSPGSQLQLVVCMREAAGDDASTVRTASCRCLSLYAVYCGRQHANEATGFVGEAVQLLMEMLGDDEKVLTVRARAAWAIANLCESSSPPPFVTHLSADLLYSLVASIITACAVGNDKVVAHAIRAAGNVGRWLTLTASGSEALWQRLVSTAVSVLESSRSVKSRWNACHAMGNLLRNPHLTTNTTTTHPTTTSASACGTTDDTIVVTAAVGTAAGTADTAAVARRVTDDKRARFTSLSNRMRSTSTSRAITRAPSSTAATTATSSTARSLSPHSACSSASVS